MLQLRWLRPVIEASANRVLIAALLVSGMMAAGWSMNFSHAVETAQGVASDEEARMLWDTGVEAYGARKFREAIPALERLIGKYPSDANSLEAKNYLARSYVIAREPEKAIPMFRAYIEASGKTPTGLDARLALAGAYLDAKKYAESLLTVEELLNASESPQTIRARAILVQSQARSSLGQVIEAQKSLTAFQIMADRDPELEKELSSSYLVTLFVKAAECERFPSSPELPAGQIVDQAQRKGLCVLQMANDLMRASYRLTPKELESGSETFLTSWQSLQSMCANPPVEKGKRPAKQVETEKKEIVARLRETCDGTRALVLRAFPGKEGLAPLVTRLAPLSAVPTATPSASGRPTPAASVSTSASETKTP